MRPILLAALALPLVAGPAHAQATKPPPLCHIAAPLEGTAAAQAQVEVRVRALAMNTTQPREGRISLVLAPDAGGDPAYAQRAIVEVSHLLKNPQPASEHYRPTPGWQKVAVKLEKTRGTGDKGNPYRLRLAAGREAYGLEPLSKGTERQPGGAWFRTDKYGGKGIGVAEMDLGRQLSRNRQDMVLTLENTDGTNLASWTIAAADLAAGKALMDKAYPQVDAAATAKSCKTVPAIGPY